MSLAFPKPKDQRKPVKTVFTLPDGREWCNMQIAQGKNEYSRRIGIMLDRQDGMCCLWAYAPMCPGKLDLKVATFDHEFGRGMGGSKRDDRIELPDGTWINGAAHESCNKWKGSRYVDFQWRFQK